MSEMLVDSTRDGAGEVMDGPGLDEIPRETEALAVNEPHPASHVLQKRNSIE